MSCPSPVTVLRETPSCDVVTPLVITAGHSEDLSTYPSASVFPASSVYPGVASAPMDEEVATSLPVLILRETPSVTIYCDPEV